MNNPSCFRVEGHIGLLRGPDAMQKNGQLACHSHHGCVFSPLAASSSEVKAPLSQRRVFSLWPKYMVRALDQKTSQIDVAGLGDAELRITIARLTASWSQPEIATHVPTGLKRCLFPRVRTYVRAVTDSMDLQQSLCLGVLRLREFEDLPIVLLDLEGQLRDLLAPDPAPALVLAASPRWTSAIASCQSAT